MYLVCQYPEKGLLIAYDVIQASCDHDFGIAFREILVEIAYSSLYCCNASLISALVTEAKFRVCTDLMFRKIESFRFSKTELKRRARSKTGVSLLFIRSANVLFPGPYSSSRSLECPSNCSSDIVFIA